MADDVPFLNEEKFVAAILTAGFIASGQKAGFTGATVWESSLAALQAVAAEPPRASLAEKA